MSGDQKTSDRLICVGKIISAHGIRGAVNLQSFTENPADVFSYGPLCDKNGNGAFTGKIININSDKLIATFTHIKTRNDAESARGLELFINRSSLPEPEADEFYLEDLKGLKIYHHKNKSYLGNVLEILDFGAGPILSFSNEHGVLEYLSFTAENVPNINLQDGFLTIIQPEIVTLTETSEE